MLIHLDRSAVADAVSASSTASLSHRCIENLLLAHFEGNHAVSLFPEDVAALGDATLRWSERAGRALDHIGENYPQIAGLREDVAWSMELGLGEGFDRRQHVVGEKAVLRAPLHDFERVQSISCSTVLGENGTDADFFCQLGLMMRAVRRWERTNQVVDPRGGGGQNTALEYERLAQRGLILLAIADTDRRHPAGGAGSTYSKLHEKAMKRPAFQRARPLPTRTAEGLVPLAVYRDVLKDPAQVGRLDRLKQLLHSAPADLLRYANLKNGLTLYQVENPTNEAEGAYWSDIAKGSRRDRCVKGSVGQCTTREQCECHVIDRLGDHALSEVVQWMTARKSKGDLALRFGLRENVELAALADEVLSWGIALAPLLT